MDKPEAQKRFEKLTDGEMLTYGMFKFVKELIADLPQYSVGQEVWVLRNPIAGEQYPVKTTILPHFHYREQGWSYELYQCCVGRKEKDIYPTKEAAEEACK